MKLIGAAILLVGVVLAQGHGGSSRPVPIDPPNAAARAEISRENYKKNVEEAGKLLRVATELKTDLDQQTGLVFPAKTAKDLEEIKKLANSIAKRLKSE